MSNKRHKPLVHQRTHDPMCGLQTQLQHFTFQCLQSWHYHSL